MTNKPENPMAFPTEQPAYVFGDGEGNESPVYKLMGGMTLLDYFAGQALVGQLACRENPLVTDGSYHSADPIFLAAGCYRIAKAMLTERAKEPTQ